MAAIRKRKGKYEVQIRRKGFSPISRTFHNYADAQEWARHMEVQADRGELPSPIKKLDSYTVKDILQRYKDEVSAKKRSYYSEKYALDHLMQQSFANKTLAEITATKICDYRDARLKVVKAGTVRRDLAILRHAFDIAEREWGIPIRENPLKKLARIKPQAGRKRRLAPEEYEAIKKAAIDCKNKCLPDLIDFAIATGMRRGEMLRLKLSDIDFKAKTLHIPVTKNGHSRTIPLSGQAIEILEGRRKYADTNKGLVFPTSCNAVQLAWQRLIKRADIKDLHFHDLRHEAISRFFERGLAVPEVALISGHRDFRMLFRYTHLKPEDIAEKLG